MAARITDARHQRLTRIGDLLDELAELVITASTWIAVFALGAIWGAALLLAALHRMGVWQ